MLRPNDHLGPYVIKKKLGQGSFGEVWLAVKQTPLAVKEVAVKLPLTEEPDIEKIRQEVRVWMQAAGHPNVLPVIEADVYDGIVVIVSEYAMEGSLTDWLKRYGGGAPSVESAIQMSRGILEGLSYLHSLPEPIIHRDLKPSNIMLRGGKPCIADFGLARVLKSSNKSTTISGTVPYMSPEALRGDRSVLTDLWSAGVILYVMLAGRLPFEHGDMFRLMQAIWNEEPDPLPKNVPAALQDMVSRSLAKDPVARYPSAGAMLSALDDAWQLCRAPWRGRGADEATTLPVRPEVAPPATVADKPGPGGYRPLTSPAGSASPVPPLSSRGEKKPSPPEGPPAPSVRRKAEEETVAAAAPATPGPPAAESPQTFPVAGSGVSSGSRKSPADLQQRPSPAGMGEESGISPGRYISQAPPSTGEPSKTIAREQQPGIPLSEAPATIITPVVGQTRAAPAAGGPARSTAGMTTPPEPVKPVATLGDRPAPAPAATRPRGVNALVVVLLILAALGVGGIAVLLMTRPGEEQLKQEPTGGGRKVSTIQYSHYIDNADDTITDTATGLMWTKSDSRAATGKGMNWNEAKAWVDGLTTGGHTDWRMPTIAELKSIYDEAYKVHDDNEYPPLHMCPLFASGGAYYFWSSEDAGSGSSRYMYFFDGSVQTDQRSDSSNDYIGVRGVRLTSGAVPIPPAPSPEPSSKPPELAGGIPTTAPKLPKITPTPPPSTQPGPKAGQIGSETAGGSEEKDFSARLGMKFVQVSAGSFVMGAADEEHAELRRSGQWMSWFNNELPRHRVTISQTFYLQTTEVTQAQWKAVMGNNPSHFQKGDDYPVENVFWDDVQEFIRRLNASDPGKGYRLPTEAEWEYACRAVKSGERDGGLDAIAWYDGNSGGSTHPVGRKRPNGWGLYDLLGNVREWCSDWYGEKYYSESPTSDPTGPSGGRLRVCRGGSWFNDTSRARASYRAAADPADRFDHLGFRLVRVLPR